MDSQTNGVLRAQRVGARTWHFFRDLPIHQAIMAYLWNLH